MKRWMRMHALGWAAFTALTLFALLEFAVELADAAPPSLASYTIWNRERDPELLTDTGQFTFASRFLWEPRVHVADVQPDGHRGSSLAESRDGELRIAAIGDATTFGSGIGFGDAWPAQLEIELAKKNVAAQVLNFGVAEHSTVQGCARYAARVAALQPDLVIACFGEYSDRWPAPDGVDDAERVRRTALLGGRPHPLLDRFSSLRWLRQALDAKQPPIRTDAGERASVHLVQESLKTLRDAVQGTGAKLLVIVAPLPPQHPRAKDAAGAAGELVKIAGELQIPLVRADVALGALPVDEVFLGPAWWTARAHAIVARETSVVAERMHLLGPGSRR